jgi:hypothetical protein
MGRYLSLDAGSLRRRLSKLAENNLGMEMKKQSIQIIMLYFASLILLSGCGSAFEKCVEAKQDAYKKENPNENYEKLVREREIHERECQNLR